MQPSQDNGNNQAGQDPSKLYVGNLAYSVTEDELRGAFSEYGDIEECKLIMDFRTGRSKGFAFVKFANEEQASAAMEALNEQDLQGRKMFIKVAMPPRPREERRSFGGDRNDRGGDRRGGFDRNRRDN
jgi:RNA recognition motif-containing protein